MLREMHIKTKQGSMLCRLLIVCSICTGLHFVFSIVVFLRFTSNPPDYVLGSMDSGIRLIGDDPRLGQLFMLVPTLQHALVYEHRKFDAGPTWWFLTLTVSLLVGVVLAIAYGILQLIYVKLSERKNFSRFGVLVKNLYLLVVLIFAALPFLLGVRKIYLHKTLFTAVEHNDLATANRVLSWGADANDRISGNKNRPILDSILPLGQGSWSSSALMRAARRRHIEMVKLLLQYGADPRAWGSDGYQTWTVLGDAAEVRSPEIVKLLIRAGADVNVLHKLKTPLMLAVGDLDYPMNPNPLTYSQQDSLECVKALVAAKANVMAKDSQGWTALNYAARAGNTGVVEFLRRQGVELSYLDAVGVGDFRLASSLPQTSADVKAIEDELGLLMLAVRKGRLDVVRFLVNRGARLNLTEGRYYTPLAASAKIADTNMVRLLISLGAKPDARPEFGRTALMEAALGNHIHIARLLLQKGAGVDRKETIGRTALTFAAEKGYTDMVKLLLRQGAKASIPNIHGVAAIDYARNGNHPDIVKILEDATKTPIRK